MRRSTHMTACSSLVIASLGLLACGGNHATDGGTDGAPVDSAGGPDAIITTPPDGPPLVGAKHTLTYPTTAVTPGEENTKCVWIRLDNDAPIKVHQLHNVLSNQSHHLIVYRDDQDTTEQLTPVACRPFSGALNASGRIAPFMITQKKDDPLTLPTGVAYTLAAHQMIKLEMHYLNSTEMPQDAGATVDLYEAEDAAAITDEADILFIGTPDINLAAGETKSVHEFFTLPGSANLGTPQIFAITGHTHQYGTSVKVATADGPTSTATQVYGPPSFLWSEPETTTHSPAFTIPTGGGFDFECDYHNTSNQAVGFGESANDEMCFFWAYYYPSRGSRVCVHTAQAGGPTGLNVCCPVPDTAPASDKQLCAYLAQTF